MKTFFSFFLLFFTNKSVKIQVIDSAIMRYFYSFSFQRDSLNPNDKGSDVMVLDIGKNTSLF